MKKGESIGLKDATGKEILIGDRLIIESIGGYWAEIKIIWYNYAVAALYENTKGGNMQGKNHIVYLHELISSDYNWKIKKIS